eukprot:scaffold11053_cov126-Skeletonema_marinoi.AAC.1
MTKKELHHSHQDDEPFNNDCLSVSESASPRPMTSSGPLAHSTQRLSQTVHSAYCPAVHDHVHVHSLSYSASNILHYIVIKKTHITKLLPLAFISRYVPSHIEAVNRLQQQQYGCTSIRLHLTYNLGHNLRQRFSVLSDVSHVALDFTTLLSPNTAVIRLFTLVGRMLVISSDYIQDQYISPDDWAFNLFMLALSARSFLKSVRPMIAVAAFGVYDANPRVINTQTYWRGVTSLDGQFVTTTINPIGPYMVYQDDSGAGVPYTLPPYTGNTKSPNSFATFKSIQVQGECPGSDETQLGPRHLDVVR